MESNILAKKTAQLIWEKKGADILIMDLRRLTTITDFFVIASVDTEIQARAIVDHLEEQLRPEGIRPWHIEGTMGSEWILLDYVDVVVHLFRPQTRSFYNLERLWGDAEIEEIQDDSF